MTTQVRRCPSCGEVKPLDSLHWHRDASSKTGFQGYCAECQRARMRTYAGNAAQRAAQLRYRAEHHDELLAREAEWRAAHRVRRRDQQREYYHANREMILQRIKERRIASRIAAGLPPRGQQGRPKLLKDH